MYRPIVTCLSSSIKRHSWSGRDGPVTAQRHLVLNASDPQPEVQGVSRYLLLRVCWPSLLVEKECRRCPRGCETQCLL